MEGQGCQSPGVGGQAGDGGEPGSLSDLWTGMLMPLCLLDAGLAM